LSTEKYRLFYGKLSKKPGARYKKGVSEKLPKPLADKEICIACLAPAMIIDNVFCFTGDPFRVCQQTFDRTVKIQGGQQPFVIGKERILMGSSIKIKGGIA
jgi:hypothetical protein